MDVNEIHTLRRRVQVDRAWGPVELFLVEHEQDQRCGQSLQRYTRKQAEKAAADIYLGTFLGTCCADLAKKLGKTATYVDFLVPPTGIEPVFAA